MFSRSIIARNLLKTSRMPQIQRQFSNTARIMSVHNIANKAEFNAALQNNEVVIMDAFATWCGPCKTIAPTVAKFSEQFPNAHFIKVDVDEVPDVAQELGVRAMPTFYIFKNGEKVGEVVGANPPVLKAAITKIAGPPVA